MERWSGPSAIHYLSRVITERKLVGTIDATSGTPRYLVKIKVNLGLEQVVGQISILRADNQVNCRAAAISPLFCEYRC